MATVLVFVRNRSFEERNTVFDVSTFRKSIHGLRLSTIEREILRLEEEGASDGVATVYLNAKRRELGAGHASKRIKGEAGCNAMRL
jgi:hypothetical protein